ncbi:[FeFe]-hydrogenase maturation radical SAM domain iron-sulfur cluster-binding oxidoreductase HydE [Syntrophotalea carbinolica DSM 2380]|uniref:[FeFe]-hydrogenase maturation radical SAM domain iron-sulfur cluster-binding oxidoreductase HydE n=1 Tax=Syntrophotalea carbinolica (strain DSM 2380 / NBRC 103641 / GraBd1) TaxID=338963 RepID=Q3A431_SYNC1|nr:[FeFe] hydrogenase H-cluster radical SAM maturase HydE [Syntrophotalea carbinolica]ABA88876.1 [FeFe]-hydrogenase maturation radical SAM domain iron-sulfur cluster-binding oxidoreductase HydE [Syntrophotalea carbinolica DSM 2380]
MNYQDIIRWLKCPPGPEVYPLRDRADQIRQQYVGDAVHLRGLVELSNICSRNCLYCGIRRDNQAITRYRLTADEVLDCARKAVDFGFGTLVLQGGEDPGLSKDFIGELISLIKSETNLAVTLSLGERKVDEWAAWREAGADRYLLRFETSNSQLFNYIHPPRDGHAPCDRISMLKTLQSLGYETGSGVMIGIPGQTYEDLARDIELFGELSLDMIGVGPFIPHPQTPLGAGQVSDAGIDQVPGSVEMGLRVLALARIVCPGANIPSTTAFATLDRQAGREMGLCWGANVVMPNLTPLQYRKLYEIYPSKAASTETAEESRDAAFRQIEHLGRTPGSGRGDSPHHLQQTTTSKRKEG